MKSVLPETFAEFFSMWPRHLAESERVHRDGFSIRGQEKVVFETRRA